MAAKLGRHKSVISGSLMVDIVIYFIAGFLAVITVWPFIYVFSMSISAPEEVVKQTVWFFPKGFTLDTYKLIFRNNDLWRSYANTIFYVTAGTFLSTVVSLFSAYSLSKKGLFGKKFIAIYMIIPMYFSGGLIPYFILINKLGLFNKPLVMVIPGIVSVWNIILARTFISTLPESLKEAAIIDGAGDIGILFKIIIPLSKPIIAVIVLYMAVSIWNNWFNALMFLPNKKWQPLQLFMARVLIYAKADLSVNAIRAAEEGMKLTATAIQLKYAAIIFTTLPILCTYPFLQKYFVKGALIGSIKE